MDTQLYECIKNLWTVPFNRVSRFMVCEFSLKKAAFFKKVSIVQTDTFSF